MHVGWSEVASQNLRDLVGMSLTDRFGGEKEGVALLGDTVGDGSSSHDEKCGKNEADGRGRSKKQGGREEGESWKVVRTREVIAWKERKLESGCFSEIYFWRRSEKLSEWVGRPHAYTAGENCWGRTGL